VIRLPTAELIGYVQATVVAEQRATIASVLSSPYWGRGLARRAVEVMIHELVAQHGVRRLAAVLKRDNRRSQRLLERLGFAPASEPELTTTTIAADERLMVRDLENARAML
jgi:RimJ/RimL family protein N-acetyltransferase